MLIWQDGWDWLIEQRVDGVGAFQSSSFWKRRIFWTLGVGP